MKNKLLSFSAFCKSITIFTSVLLFNVGITNAQTDIAVNGGFESGDFTGWTQFISGTQTVVSGGASEGTFYAELNNTVSGSASVLKNANLGVGVVSPGQEVTISFDARGNLGVGAVAFAQFFSELSGGGTSAAPILGGGPLALDPDPNTWKSFSFTINTGTDVSGGVTLELTATTGAVEGSTSFMNYDNIKVTLTDSGPSARVQVIHNSPDAIASEVDVYLNGDLALDNFAFRTASPFINVPAGTEISVAVAPSNSTSVADAVATFPYTLTEGETYVLVASGIVSPTGYSPATPFDIAVYALGQESAGTTGNTDVLVYHGVTDAPTVDVNEVTGPSVLVNDISYGEFNGYLELPTADYSINVSTADGSTVVESYDAPLATLGLDDEAIVVVASGFLDPSVNSNGPAFGLWVALPSGGALVELPITDPNDPNTPSVAAPTPTLPASDVVSMFSDAYTDVPVDTWRTVWSNATLTDLEIQGNPTKRYTALVFNGIETIAEPINAVATEMEYFHMDIWTPNITTFRVKLVDFRGDGFGGTNGDTEAELIFTVPQGTWHKLDIPLADFAAAGMNNFTDLSQYIISTPDPNGTVFIDNVYFSKVSTLSIADIAANEIAVFPNPSNDNWTINAVTQTITNVIVFDILGKQVVNINPNAAEAVIDASSLRDGLYLAKISTENGSQTVKLIKN